MKIVNCGSSFQIRHHARQDTSKGQLTVLNNKQVLMSDLLHNDRKNKIHASVRKTLPTCRKLKSDFR